MPATVGFGRGRIQPGSYLPIGREEVAGRTTDTNCNGCAECAYENSVRESGGTGAEWLHVPYLDARPPGRHSPGRHSPGRRPPGRRPFATPNPTDHRIMHRTISIACLTLLATLSDSSLPADAASPAGVWKGRWTSQSTGHQGPMRARIRQLDENTYRAWFAGRFAGIVPFAYPTTLERVPGSCNCFRSRQRLPLMGTYQMTAAISSGRFDARFRSRDDWGNFRMVRRR